MGSHAELLKQNGHYYRLYTQQFRKELAEQYDPFALLLDGAEPALPSHNGKVAAQRELAPAD